MNGGYAVKLGLPAKHGRAALEAALASVALSEGLGLELLELSQSQADKLVDAPEPRLIFGVLLTRREAILVPRDKYDTIGSQALAAALASWFEGPVAWVLHTDDSLVSMEGWNGGDALEPDTGMLSFGDSPIEWYVEFVLPAFEPVKGAWARRLLDALAAARSGAHEEVELNFTQVAGRARGGLLSEAIDDLLLTGTVAGKPFSVRAQRKGPAGTVDEVLDRAGQALDRFEFPEHVRAREFPATPAQLRDLRAQLPRDVTLESVVRVGPRRFQFLRAEWRARGALDGAPFEVGFIEQLEPGLAAPFLEALAGLRAERERDAQRALTERYLAAMHEGDFERAAQDYARLHFGDSADVPDGLERARKKIDELAVLYRLTPRR